MIKYPINYLVEPSSDGLSVCINKNQPHDPNMLCLDASGFIVQLKSNLNKLSLDAFVQQDEENPTEVITYKHEQTTINGTNGVKSVQTSECTGVGCGLNRFYFQKGNQIVELMYSPGGTTQPDLDTILSTFQFTK